MIETICCDCSGLDISRQNRIAHLPCLLVWRRATRSSPLALTKLSETGFAAELWPDVPAWSVSVMYLSGIVCQGYSRKVIVLVKFICIFLGTVLSGLATSPRRSVARLILCLPEVRESFGVPRAVVGARIVPLDAFALG